MRNTRLNSSAGLRACDDTTAHIVALAKGAEDALEWWQQRSGLYKLTAQGLTTWYGFTQAILENATLFKKPLLTPIVARLSVAG